jgi:hypothetical protein
MTEKIAARAVVVVFALLFSIVVRGCSLPTAIEVADCARDVGATKRAMPTGSATFSRFARLTCPLCWPT